MAVLSSQGPLLERTCMVDPWRLSNPTAGGFIFYFHAQHFWSRTDNIFVHQSLQPKVKSTKTENIIISDHRPVVLSGREARISLGASLATWRQMKALYSFYRDGK